MMFVLTLWILVVHNTASLDHLPPKVGEIRVTCGRLGNYSSDLDAELRRSSKGMM